MLADRIDAFLLPKVGARGAIVRLDGVQQKILSHLEYPEAVGAWLGQTLAASALIMHGLKDAARVSLQMSGSGGLTLLLAECTAEFSLRGIGRWRGAISDAWAEASQDGRFAITVTPTQGDQPYQGVVPVVGHAPVDGIVEYFERSVQVPTYLYLAANARHASGIIIQRLASLGGNETRLDPDGFNRIGHLMRTLSDRELLGTDPERMVARLLAEEEYFFTAEQQLRFGCRCSRDRVKDMLRSLGREECAAGVAANAGVLEVRCEFCGQAYTFDAIDAESLFHISILESDRRQ
jgi:molecular chaperone Hsp33